MYWLFYYLTQLVNISQLLQENESPDYSMHIKIARIISKGRHLAGPLVNGKEQRSERNFHNITVVLTACAKYEIELVVY